MKTINKRIVLGFTVIPLLLLVVWAVWLQPRPWELWKRTATQEELNAHQVALQQCFDAWHAGNRTGKYDAAKAEYESCKAKLPELTWELKERYMKKADCFNEWNERVGDKKRDVYDCVYREKSRWEFMSNRN